MDAMTGGGGPNPVVQMLKWFIGRDSGASVAEIGGMKVGEGLFVLIYTVLLVIIGVILNQALRPRM